MLARSEDVVKASIDSEENASWNRKIFIFRGGTDGLLEVSLKEIENFVFNKSTQKTRTRLSRLILHKKEAPRRRINPKDWLQNEL